jgi:hypothetical protein
MRQLAFVAVGLIAASPTLADPAQWHREGWKTDFEALTVGTSEIRTVIPRDSLRSQGGARRWF